MSKIFGIKKLERTRFQIILWWEIRRIIFNIFLLLIIFGGLKIIGLNVSEVEMGNGDYFVFLILIGFLFILNILYTFGWISELFRKRSLTFAPKLFKNIILLSVLLYACLIAAVYYILLK